MSALGALEKIGGTLNKFESLVQVYKNQKLLPADPKRPGTKDAPKQGAKQFMEMVIISETLKRSFQNWPSSISAFPSGLSYSNVCAFYTLRHPM